MSKNRRYFETAQTDDNGEPIFGQDGNYEWYGRYTGLNPRQAASKVFTTMRKINKSIESAIIIVREITLDANIKKIYRFEYKRVRMEAPHEITLPNGSVMLQHYVHICKIIHDDAGNVPVSINTHTDDADNEPNLQNIVQSQISDTISDLNIDI